MMPDKADHTEEPKTEHNPTKGLDIASVAESWGFKGQNYLYTIGIDQYKYWAPLKNAVKDVQDFATILMNHYQFDEEHHFALLNKKATLKNILKYFRELFQKVTPEDNLVIYFSGHGHYDERTKTGYWIPIEANKNIEYEHEYLNTAIIFDKLKNIDSLHTFLLIDACFSGALLYRNKSGPRPERYKSRLVFASGRDEVVSDGQEGGNSPFAKALIEGLTRNTDKYISASELIVIVKKEVGNYANQTPVDSRLINSGDKGGDFVFHLKMSEAEIWAQTISQNTKEMYRKFMEQFPQSAHHQEAQEAYDWLTASHNNTMPCLRWYLDKYQPDGKYIPLAIKTLKNLEEEECWKKAKAKAKDISSGYYEYLYQYPAGKYEVEARRRISQSIEVEDEDDQAFRRAMEEGTPEALQAYLDREGTRKHQTIVEQKLLLLKKEEKAWEKAQNINTYIAYHDFIQAYPKSRFSEDARQEMNRLDIIEFKRIQLVAESNTISLKEKIRQCIQYFDEFPGAANNIYVKQIKDRLEISGH